MSKMHKNPIEAIFLIVSPKFVIASPKPSLFFRQTQSYDDKFSQALILFG